MHALLKIRPDLSREPCSAGARVPRNQVVRW
jgi:hypothetical protein